MEVFGLRFICSKLSSTLRRRETVPEFRPSAVALVLRISPHEPPWDNRCLGVGAHKRGAHVLKARERFVNVLVCGIVDACGCVREPPHQPHNPVSGAIFIFPPAQAFLTFSGLNVGCPHRPHKQATNTKQTLLDVQEHRAGIPKAVARSGARAIGVRAIGVRVRVASSGNCTTSFRQFSPAKEL